MDIVVEKTYFDVMHTIKNSDGSLGAVKIKKYLEDKGIDISEATIGRILARLDEDGLTEKQGNNGRVLTEKGERKLIEYEFVFKSQEYYNSILNLIDTTGPAGMIEYLDAREAIELQAVELAIRNMTQEELSVIESILKEQMEIFYNYKSHKPTKSQGHLDYQFHKAIIKASKNPFLEAFYGLLRCSEQVQMMYEFIAGQRYIEDHLRIFQSIKEKDVNKAKEYLKKHIDGVKQECLDYWKQRDLCESFLDR